MRRAVSQRKKSKGPLGPSTFPRRDSAARGARRPRPSIFRGGTISVRQNQPDYWIRQGAKIRSTANDIKRNAEALAEELGEELNTIHTVFYGAATPEVFDRLNGLGELARTRLRRIIAESEIPAQVTGCGSLFRIHLTERTLLGYRDTYPSPEERARLSNVYEYLLDHGILISPTGMCALTTPMDESDIDALCGMVRAGFAQLN